MSLIWTYHWREKSSFGSEEERREGKHCPPMLVLLLRWLWLCAEVGSHRVARRTGRSGQVHGGEIRVLENNFSLSFCLWKFCQRGTGRATELHPPTHQRPHNQISGRIILSNTQMENCSENKFSTNCFIEDISLTWVFWANQNWVVCYLTAN